MCAGITVIFSNFTAILSVLFCREAGSVTHGVVLLWEGLGMKSRAPLSTYTMTRAMSPGISGTSAIICLTHCAQRITVITRLMHTLQFSE